MEVKHCCKPEPTCNIAILHRCPWEGGMLGGQWSCTSAASPKPPFLNAVAPTLLSKHLQAASLLHTTFSDLAFQHINVFFEALADFNTSTGFAQTAEMSMSKLHVQSIFQNPLTKTLLQASSLGSVEFVGAAQAATVAPVGEIVSQPW